MSAAAGAAPIPGLLDLLRRERRIPAEAESALDRIGALPPEAHQQALLAEGIVSEEDIAQTVAKDTGLPFRAIDPVELNAEVVTGALPAPFARRHTICALSRQGGALTVAVANPYERSAIDDLERYLGIEVEVVVSTRSDIESVNGSLYNLRTSLRAAESELEDQSGGEEIPDRDFISEADAAGDLEPTTRPVVSALDSILRQAFEHRASDIHIEPKRDRAVVRFRVDGVLRTMHTFPRIVYRAVVSRIKMLSGLDIAEKRRPQDGRFKRVEPEKEIELRVSTLPTVFGEKAVLRVFDPAALVSTLEELRLAEDEDARLRAMLGRREGLVLVTGPTGSGKTTTLYSVLRQVATPEVNVITIEDPVELIQPALSQVQVHHRIEFTFAAAIRSVLRQDPDILMVGEIRDPETAEMAVQAALTGHLVLATLHTNDAASSVTRLADLGVPRFLVSTTLVGVLAQRLVRTVCPRCAETAPITAAEAAALGVPELAGRKTRRGRGCARCRESGYRGRRGVFEVLPVDPGAAARILGGADAAEIARYARHRGCRSLRQSALRLLLAGETTTSEVVRVTGAGKDPGAYSGRSREAPGEVERAPDEARGEPERRPENAARRPEVVRVTGAGKDPGASSGRSREAPGEVERAPDEARGEPERRPANAARRPDEALPAGRRGDPSEAERAAHDQQERRNPVEQGEDIADRRRPTPDGDFRQPAGAGQGHPANPPHRIDEPDAEQVEQQVHHRDLEAPRGVRAGDGEGGEERRDRGAHIRAERHRKGVVEEEQAGPRQRDEHRGGHRTRLHDHGDQGADGHREDGVLPEHPVERLPRAAPRQPAQRPHDHPQTHHDQRRGEHREQRRRWGPCPGDRLGKAGERVRGEGDQARERAPIGESGAGERAEEIERGGREAGEEAGRHLHREQDRHRHQVEQVVAGGYRERPPQRLAVPQVAEGGQGVRDRGADVRPHDHGDGALERQRGFGRRHQGDDERTGYRGTLDHRGGQHPDEEPHEGVLGGPEEPIEEPRPEALEPVAESADPAEEEEEESGQRQQAGARSAPEQAPADAFGGHSPRAGGVRETGRRRGASERPLPSAEGLPSGKAARATVGRFRFEWEA